jgi:hypothetical protein
MRSVITVIGFCVLCVSYVFCAEVAYYRIDLQNPPLMGNKVVFVPKKSFDKIFRKNAVHTTLKQHILVYDEKASHPYQIAYVLFKYIQDYDCQMGESGKIFSGVKALAYLPNIGLNEFYFENKTAALGCIERVEEYELEKYFAKNLE